MNSNIDSDYLRYQPATIPRLCDSCQKIYWSTRGSGCNLCVIEKRYALQEARFKHSISQREFFESLEKKEEKKPIKVLGPIQDCKCHFCEKEFQTRQKNRKYCSSTCSCRGEKRDQIKLANEKWLNPPAKKKHKYNLSELNRMAEWKRLYDDESWLNRYNARRG